MPKRSSSKKPVTTKAKRIQSINWMEYDTLMSGITTSEDGLGWVVSITDPEEFEGCIRHVWRDEIVNA